MSFKFNYFKLIEDKYKTRISLNKPIVIRLDGKNICKNPCINLIDETKHSFSSSLNNTAKFLSRKFNAICLAATDELNIIIPNPNFLYKYYATIECQKISSFIVQEVSSSFNNLYNGERILFDARTFNIPENKIQSYMTYRIGMAKNVYVMYYAKKLLAPHERVNVKMANIEEILNNLSPEFLLRSNHNKYGAIYYDGSEINYNDLPTEILLKDELIHYLSQFEVETVILDNTDFQEDLTVDNNDSYDFLL